LEAIKEGIIWRVGNGDDINMWVDPLIPRGTTEGRSLHGGTLSSQEFLNLLILRLGIGMVSWFVIFFGRTMCNTFSPYPSSMAGRIILPGIMIQEEFFLSSLLTMYWKINGSKINTGKQDHRAHH
jgi:hypothetical protein